MGKKSRKNLDKLKFINWSIVIVGMLLAVRWLAFLDPSVVGFVILEDKGNDTFEAAWDFSNSGDYIFGDEIELNNGAKLGTYTEDYSITDSDFEEGTFADTVIEDDALTSSRQLVPVLLTKAYYNPNDVTADINEEDSNKKDIDEDKLLYISWSEPLNDWDVLSLYINSNEETDIYVCDIFSSCDSQEYGEAHYNGSEGYLNITLNNLPAAQKEFRISPADDQIKLNYISSSHGQLEAAFYNPNDIMDKISSLDGDKKDVDKNKNLDMEFREALDNGYTISQYITDDNGVILHICDVAESCASPGYGSVEQNGGEDWLNITLSGLENPQKTFSLHKTKDTKLDYLEANYKEYIDGSFASVPLETEGAYYTLLSWDADTPAGTSLKFQLRSAASEEELENAQWYGPVGTDDYYAASGAAISTIHNGQHWVQYKAFFETDNPDEAPVLNSVTIGTAADFYYASSSIQTKDYEPSELEQWGILSYEHELSNQSISYEYSVDGGDTWETIPENNDLSAVPTGSGRIRFSATLSSDTFSTPMVNSLKLTYNVPPCAEQWIENYNECALNGTKLKYYLDANECGTFGELPSDNNTYVSCDYCQPDWVCSEYGPCMENGERYCKSAIDKNSCFSNTASDSDAYSGNYSEFKSECTYKSTVKNATVQLVSLEKNKEHVLDYSNVTNTVLELFPSADIANANISLTEHAANPKNDTVEGKKDLGRFVDIEADEAINNAIEYAILKITYTDEEIANNNLDEHSLQIYYFNETEWQPVGSWVDAEQNFVAANVSHFSSYTVYGDETGSSSGSSSVADSSGGSGGGSNWRGIIPPKEQTKEEKVPLMVSNGPVCNYRVDVQLPEDLSFVDKKSLKSVLTNTGNCSLDAVDLNVAESLTSFVRMDGLQANLAPNESMPFEMVSLADDSRFPFLIDGFAVKIRGRVVKNVSGSIIIQAESGEEMVLNETEDIALTVITTEAIAEIESSHVVVFLIIMFLSGLFSMYIAYSIWKRYKRKNKIEGNDEAKSP